MIEQLASNYTNDLFCEYLQDQRPVLAKNGVEVYLRRGDSLCSPLSRCVTGAAAGRPTASKAVYDQHFCGLCDAMVKNWLWEQTITNEMTTALLLRTIL